jgi:hypothetical protein
MEEEFQRVAGVYFKLTPREVWVLKLADLLEGMWYCVGQLKLGHVSARRPFRKGGVAARNHIENTRSGVMDVELQDIMDSAEEVYQLILTEKEKWYDGE